MKTADRQWAFTQRRLDRLGFAPAGRREHYRDAKTPGLVLAIGEHSKTFYLIKRIGSRVRRLRLGAYPQLSIAEARAKATASAHAVNQGQSPLPRRVTLRQAWEAYLLHKADGNRTRDRAVRQWSVYLAPWADWRLSDLTVSVVSDLKRGIVTKAGGTKKALNGGQTVANRVLALLSALFTQARKHCGWRGGNPVMDVERFAENRRVRYLAGPEAKRLFAALDEHPNPPIRDLMYLLLWTGARKGNVLAMHWRDIDLEAGVWTIPGDVSKTGVPVRVALVKQAVDVLARRHEWTGGEGWVFPSRGRTGHVTTIAKPWAKILAAAKITDRLTIHDLRHSAASWAYQHGASLGLIGDQLGHASTSTTKRYAHASDEAIRKAMARGADAISRAAGQTG